MARPALEVADIFRDHGAAWRRANAGQLVGDYRNPILTPDAAVVKQKGELAIAGKGFPNAQDQCRPMAPPFALAMQLGL